MTTPAEFTNWLTSDKAQPVALIEAAYAGGIEYLSTHEYISGVGDTPANQIYINAIHDDVVIDDTLERGSVGEIHIVHDGEFDDWVSRAWAGHALRVYLGDRSWARDDFVLMVDGQSGGISAPRPGRLRLAWADRREQLRQAIIGETDVAITLGEAFNVPAVLTADFPSFVFSVHDGAITSVVVRDNGVLLTAGGGNDYTVNLATGDITLEAVYGSPAGQIAADVVQADSTLEDIVTALCGRASVSVDAVNLAAFPSTAALGLHIDSATSLDALLREVTESLGATYRFSPTGALQVFRIEEPAMAADYTLDSDDIVVQGIQLQQIQAPFARTTLRYRKNYAPQSVDSLASSLTPAAKEDLATDFLEVTASNALPDYPLAGERTLDTLIANQADAQSECDRRNTLRAQPRYVHQVDALMAGLEIPLGATASITYPYEGFGTGRNVLVIGNRRRLVQRRARLTTWH